MPHNYRRVVEAAEQTDEMQQAPIVLPVGMNGTEQMVMLIPAPPPDRRPQRWNQGRVKGIGMALMLLAMIAIVCNIVWFSVKEPSLAPVGVGFWAGGLVLVTGMLMTASGFRPSRCLIVSVLVMSIIANVFDTAFLTIGTIQAAVLSYDYDCSGLDGCTSSDNSVNVRFGALYIVIGIVCFGLLLTASILSCVSLCSRSTSYYTIAHVPRGTVIGQGTAVAQQGAFYMHGAPVKVDQMQMNYSGGPQRSSHVAPPSYDF